MLLLLGGGVLVSVAIAWWVTETSPIGEREIALLGAWLFGGLTAFAIWHAIERMVLRDVRAMLAATERLREGDYRARTGMRHGNTEMDRLAREFDGMAAALQEHQAEAQRAEERLRLSEARKSAVLEASFDGILVLDARGRVLECNAAARALFGFERGECECRSLAELFPAELPFDPTRFNRPAEVYEASARRRDGREFTVELSIAPIRDPEAHGLFVATVRDITARKQLERSLEGLSFTDELTHTYNRRGFLMFASQQLRMAARSGQSVVLVSVDLDGLKRINDAFGHPNGDRALIELADALRASFRDIDVIGRLGGDEFVVLATETEGEGAERALERFTTRLANRNAVGDLPWRLSASIGWLRADPSAEGASLGEMLARADERMYAQKNANPVAAGPWAPSLEPDPRHASSGPGLRSLPRVAPLDLRDPSHRQLAH